MGQFLEQVKEKSDKWAAFVEEYCTGARSGRPFNQTRAAEVAGYVPGALQQRGYELMKNPLIKAAIAERLDEISMPKEEIVARLTNIARSEPGNLVTVDESGQVRFATGELEKLKPYIKSFTFDSNGMPKIEFYDSMAALTQLAKIRGLSAGDGVGGMFAGATVNLQINFVAPSEVEQSETQQIGGEEADWDWDEGMDDAEG
jgi:hypothetical protein